MTPMEPIDTSRLHARYDHAALRPWIYIAGPMTTHGNPYANVKDGIEAGDFARRKGWHPVIPHLDAFVTMVKGELDIEEIMSLDFGFINKCDAVLFLPDWDRSTGANEEYIVARDYGKAMFFGVHELPEARHVFPPRAPTHLESTGY